MPGPPRTPYVQSQSGAVVVPRGMVAPTARRPTRRVDMTRQVHLFASVIDWGVEVHRRRDDDRPPGRVHQRPERRPSVPPARSLQELDGRRGPPHGDPGRRGRRCHSRRAGEQGAVGPHQSGLSDVVLRGRRHRLPAGVPARPALPRGHLPVHDRVLAAVVRDRRSRGGGAGRPSGARIARTRGGRTDRRTLAHRRFERCLAEALHPRRVVRHHRGDHRAAVDPPQRGASTRGTDGRHT